MTHPGKLLSILLQIARCQALPKTPIRPKQTRQAFPDRTFEALKQTYHKRRHAVEQKIEEEKASDKAPKKD
ncbi:hypothetical protein FOXB_13350 [Fusarium oxysporum f. sp. conglutinans Fo5176]|uniref:Uncharacterized protein n=1 Tax=Fusarium oxysporum (strain Fo5176) TaxID=660025 RepID=F9G3W8_FUSOF|nr:hypothetical protein FOXB_13350 [Fusarium oxysporum f. sp. conglutinans Fo5176]